MYVYVCVCVWQRESGDQSCFSMVDMVSISRAFKVLYTNGNDVTYAHHCYIEITVRYSQYEIIIPAELLLWRLKKKKLK